LQELIIEGQRIPLSMLQVNRSMTVGDEAYDVGAQLLSNFFREQLAQFDESDLDPLGRRIIQCTLSNGTMADYESLIDAEPVIAANDD
jgi:hypothetical protein